MAVLQFNMPYSWKENLDLAKSLSLNRQDQFSEELRERVAMSRVYFGTYCQASDYAETHPDDSKIPFNKTGKASDHINVRTYFLKHKDNDFSKIGSLLESLRKWRNIADYRKKFTAKEHLQDAIKYSEKVFKKLGP